MLWSAYLLAATAPASTDPITGVTGQILSYGVVGAIAVVLAIVLYRGTFVRATDAKADADARVAAARAEADTRVELARADLLRHVEQVERQLEKAEGQRDEAVKLAQTQVVPLLTTFNGTVSALLPILQQLTRYDDLPSRRWESHERERP